MTDTMTTKQCKVYELTADERRKCGYLSFKSDGDLWNWLREFPNADVVIIQDDDKIIGWAMRTPDGETGYYVRKTHRRQGIGSRLYYLLNKRRQTSAVVKPHDPNSAAFFYSLGRMRKRDAVELYDAPRSIKRKPRRAVMGN